MDHPIVAKRLSERRALWDRVTASGGSLPGEGPASPLRVARPYGPSARTRLADHRIPPWRGASAVAEA